MKYYHMYVRLSVEKKYRDPLRDFMVFDITDPGIIRERVSDLMNGINSCDRLESAPAEILGIVVLSTSERVCRWVERSNLDYCRDAARWDALLKKDLFGTKNEICGREDITELVLAECRAKLDLPSDYDPVGKRVYSGTTVERTGFDEDGAACPDCMADFSSEEEPCPEPSDTDAGGELGEEGFRCPEDTSVPGGPAAETGGPADSRTKDRRVFIVHGHDGEALASVKYFLLALNFDPVVLYEQPNGGRTVIDKIEGHTDVGFGIVLYTPCDAGFCREKPETVLPRARQNVVFEHGYLIARLGRGNVCALYKEGIERPSDMAGVLFIRMDESRDWRVALAMELENAGYGIDQKKLLREMRANI